MTLNFLWLRIKASSCLQNFFMLYSRGSRAWLWLHKVDTCLKGIHALFLFFLQLFQYWNLTRWVLKLLSCVISLLLLLITLFEDTARLVSWILLLNKFDTINDLVRMDRCRHSFLVRMTFLRDSLNQCWGLSAKHCACRPEIPFIRQDFLCKLSSQTSLHLECWGLLCYNLALRIALVEHRCLTAPFLNYSVVKLVKNDRRRQVSHLLKLILSFLQ